MEDKGTKYGLLKIVPLYLSSSTCPYWPGVIWFTVPCRFVAFLHPNIFVLLF